MSILDLPLERQKQIAFEDGYTDLEKWQEDTRKDLEEMDAFSKALDEHKPSKAEIKKRINALLTNPYAIGFYQRVTGNYDLTVEEQIAFLKA